MVSLTVHLTPALTGVIGRVWIQLGGTWYALLDTPPSIDGVIQFGYADSYPDYPHKIVFPEQTIEGITYLETETVEFTTNNDQVLFVTLTPVTEPEPDPDKVFVETYRGVDIYFEDAVHRYWFEYDGVPYGPATLTEAHAWIDSLLQPPPPPEEYWEYHSTYREILIYIWMPSEAYYQATFGGEIHNTTSLSTLQAEIDVFLEPVPEPPIGEVTIKIVTTESDPYARYHGMSIDQSLDSSFWSTQPDKIFKMTGAGFTYIQTVTVAEGSHYVIYGNSGSAGYMWHTKIYVNDVLIAEGDVDRSNPLRGDFTAREAPPTEIQTTLTINALESVTPGEAFYLSGILYETESGIAIPNQPINHSYNGRSLGTSMTGVNGDYLKEVSIPESGVWTLRSDFLGTQTLQASRSQVKTIVTVTAIEAAIAIIGSAATGLAMFMYGLN